MDTNYITQIFEGLPEEEQLELSQYVFEGVLNHGLKW